MPDYRLARIAGSPRWYIVWTDGRRSRRRSTGTADRSQAELTLAAFRLEMAGRGGTAAPRAAISLASILDDYYDGHASKLPSAEQARIARDHLSRHFGLARITDLTPTAIDGYVKARRDAGRADDTINRELMVLSAAGRYAVRAQRLQSFPPIPLLPRPGPKERWLTRDEAARLLRACRKKRRRHLALFVRLALYTGARPGAVLDLTWDRVDLENRRIRFALPGRSQTNKRRAIVPVMGALYTALQRARRTATSDLVIAYYGDPVHSIKRAFRAIAADAGLTDVTPNTLRHTAGTWASAAGVPLYQVAGMLGHKRIQTTVERYAKHAPEFLMEAARATLRGPSARKLRASDESKTIKGLPMPRQTLDLPAQLVGAARIELATPTMSR